MSAAIALTEEQLEAIIARAAKAGAREAIALVSPLAVAPAPTPTKRRERATRVASAKATEIVAEKNKRQR